jgi:hypothetical protein
MKSSSFSPDIADFIFLLYKYHVKYIIVGGAAVIYYGHIRLTGDIDFFYEAESQNARRLYDALLEFWDGSIPGISSAEDFMIEGNIIQFGVQPNRIDLINKIDEVNFKEAWESKVDDTFEIGEKRFPIYFIELNLLIINKQATGRYKDLDDLNFLKKIEKKR